MEIVQLETFLAVASYGGFHRAAAALHVSQPAVSARIQALENSLGTRLFERGPGGFSLSPAGKTLRSHAEQLLRQVALARQAVSELRPASTGALPIAASLSICTYLLPEVLKKYQVDHSDVVVSVRSGNSAQVLKMVLDGEVDFGIARSLHHPEVETISLRDDPLMLVGHPRHPSTAKRKVSLEELESLPLIAYDRGSSDWTLMNGLFRREGIGPGVSAADRRARRIAKEKTGYATNHRRGILASQPRRHRSAPPSTIQNRPKFDRAPPRGNPRSSGQKSWQKALA
jgi:DNA-binding transcriptional LysR family regulator